MLKRLIYCLLSFFLFASFPLRAQYDFAVKTIRGQMLYYQILGDGESVRVTHPEKEWPYYADNKPVGELFIPDSITYKEKKYSVVEIGSNAFYGCDSLTGVHQVSVRRIGTQAFCGCTSLKTFVFGGYHLLGRSPEEECDVYYLQSIGEGAFAYCRSLLFVTLPGTLKHIGISSFSMCTGLQEVLAHPNVERLCDATTFYGCPLMKEGKNRKKLETGWLFWSEKNNIDEKISR